jgi:hypothetical protein
VSPLPNLDHHIRVGDALSGDSVSPLVMSSHVRIHATSRHGAGGIAALRARYVRASGPRKQSLARALDGAERARATALIDAALARNAAKRRDVLSAARGKDLFGERRRLGPREAEVLVALRVAARELRAARRTVMSGTIPFAFATHFADSAAAGGFDVIVGNPPWVRLHRIPATSRNLLRSRFAVFSQPGWVRGAELAHAGAGFASQVDLAALFVERSLELLRPSGVFSLLLPSKLWRSLAGGSVRRLLGSHALVLEVDDLSESPHAFDAAVYPSIVVAARETPVRTTSVTATLVRHSTSFRWAISRDALCLDDDPASPWLLVPPDVRAAFDRLTAAGTALGESIWASPPRREVRLQCRLRRPRARRRRRRRDRRGGGARSARVDRARAHPSAGARRVVAIMARRRRRNEGAHHLVARRDGEAGS